MFRRILAHLFIIQKDEKTSDIRESDICAIISNSNKKASKKMNALLTKTNIYSQYKYCGKWAKLSVEDYENHRHRRRSWGFY